MPAPLIFDIETGPAPLDELLANAPFAAPEPPGEFDPASVKLGNLKDSAKITEKIEAARAEHAASVAGHEQRVVAAHAAYVTELLDRAPLDATTGRVLAIGYSDGEQCGVDTSDEPQLLDRFWTKAAKAKTSGRSLVGFNCQSFDIPFLVRRSWAHGLDVPLELVRDGKWPAKWIVDLRELWLLGQRWGECPSSLGHVAKFLGVGSKSADVSGGDFWRLWTSGDESQQDQARAYLLNDLRLTAGVARRLGVF
jgi:hypothetical protein